MSRVEKGDYVTIGDNDLTWCVLDIAYYPEKISAACGILESGQTGRRRIEPMRNLKIYQKGDA